MPVRPAHFRIQCRFYTLLSSILLGLMVVAVRPSLAGVQATIDNPTGSNEYSAPARSTSLGDSGEKGFFGRLEYGVAMNDSGNDSGIGLTLAGKDGFGFAAALGYQFDDNISLDMMAEWRPKFYNSYNYSSFALIPHFSYAFPFGNARPFIAVGIGMAINHSANSSNFTLNQAGLTGGTWESAQNFTLAWSAGFGVDFAVNDRIAIRAGYRYLNLGSFKAGNDLTLTRSDGGQFKVPNGLGLSKPTVDELVLGVGYMF